MARLPDGVVVVLKLPGAHAAATGREQVLICRPQCPFLRRDGRNVGLRRQVVVVLLSRPERFRVEN